MQAGRHGSPNTPPKTQPQPASTTDATAVTVTDASSSPPPPPQSHSAQRHGSLNPDAAPFSPSPVRPVGEDLPKWLMFSPSSLKGPSSTQASLAGASLASSYAEVIRGKGKASMDEAGLSSRSARSVPPPPLPGQQVHGIMADAHRDPSGHVAPA
jgi:hypothetical protein